MRSYRLFRNEKIALAFRPVWQACLFKNLQRTLVTKKIGEPDPYEGNYEFVECNQYTKVTVIGAAGRVGRTLSLLLKTCPLIDHLCLFDISKTVKGIGVDISHIDTKCCVSYVCGMRNIQQALDEPDVVVIAAGCPATPNLFGKKLFDKNAPIIAGLSEACARFCPKACIVLITNPINSLLPVMGEVYHTLTNRIPSKKLFGLTTLDVVRANTFVAEVVRTNPNSVIVPVIGGASEETIVPVISQMKPCCKIKRGEMLALTECIKRAEGNLADCQNCGARGSSSLSTAYAAFRFTSSLVMGLKGAKDIIECAFVKSDVIPELEYLASPVKLGPRGIQYNYGYPPLSDDELAGFEQAAASLISDINLGKSFVSSIEETIRRGLIWKRLIDESSKASDTDKNQTSKKVNDITVKRKRLEENKPKEEEINQVDASSAVIEKGVVYTHSGGWTAPAKTSFKSFLNPEETSQQDISTESISAEVDSCRSDQSLRVKILEDFDSTDQSSDVETNQTDYPAPEKKKILPSLNFLRAQSVMTQTVRNFHLSSTRRSSYQDRKFYRKNQNQFKRYLLQDRKNFEEQQVEQLFPSQWKQLNNSNADESAKVFGWTSEYPQNQYKGLNTAAKQKFRSFNCRREMQSQKRFDPSASVLLMLERMKKEREQKSFLNSTHENNQSEDCIQQEEQEKVEEDEEEFQDAEETNDNNESLSHSGSILGQLNELRKENEALKKRLMEISSKQKLETALQVQSDNLELERTKLKACWLIMTSTMEAFSKFCKKFTTKSDPNGQNHDKLLEEAVEQIKGEHDEEAEDEEFEDAEEEPNREREKTSNYDDKYFQFLQKLMEDHMESTKMRKTMSK